MQFLNISLMDNNRVRDTVIPPFKNTKLTLLLTSVDYSVILFLLPESNDSYIHTYIYMWEK